MSLCVEADEIGYTGASENVGTQVGSLKRDGEGVGVLGVSGDTVDFIGTVISQKHPEVEPVGA